MTSIDPRWLPAGVHYSMHIEHCPTNDDGAFTGGGKKIVWHTTETAWDTFVGVRDGFINKSRLGQGVESHLLIGGGEKGSKVSVAQFVPFNRSSRALKHPSGTSETNRANAIQIEICGFAAESGEWPDSRYKALANLLQLINHRRPTANYVPRAFTNDKRFTSGGFVTVRGHVGHKHVPFNDHTDPGDGFKIHRIFELLPGAPYKL